MAQLGVASPTSSNGLRDNGRDIALEPEHKIFLSHSGKQKEFVKQLCADLERYDRHPFFHRLQYNLPIAENFPPLIFRAIQQCHLGVVILSDDFFTSKWPMMELVAMVDEAINRESSFNILPVYLHSSLDDIQDGAVKRMQWLSLWNEWALENPERVNVEKWTATLKYLRPINSLLYDGLCEFEFRKLIVESICRRILPESKFEDSYIQGKSRMCKVIRDKIDLQQQGRGNNVCVVGLYGMHGIGKTSLCKALLNEFSTEFYGRVCHVEFPSKMESRSEEELLRQVAKKLTDARHELLNELNADQLRKKLQPGKIKRAVFMALDNMSDAWIAEALYFLGVVPSGSIVMVTAHSMSTLMRVNPYINESVCLEMPELEIDEAKLLFAKSSNFEVRSECDEGLVMRCVEQCYFQKDDGSSHYHPLALNALAKQLLRFDPGGWGSQLDMFEDKDIFNQSGDIQHPIFSIFRKSFDTLSREDQLLFMDVAVFLPAQYKGGCNVLEWLGMVHGIRSPEDVKTRLETLKTKLLLKSLGDGVKIRIGIHDLWRAFCVAETKSGELSHRRWVCETEKRSELVETNPSGTCWEKVKRMAFLGCVLKNLVVVNFAHFSNITVLKVSEPSLTKKIVVDLSGLDHLKSLDVSGGQLHRLVLQGLPRGLKFLNLESESNGLDESISSSKCTTDIGVLTDHFESWSNSRQLMRQIGCSKELQCLRLVGYGGGKLPDMRSIVSMQKAVFYDCKNVVILTGLSLSLINLRVLKFRGCQKLHSCPGVGDLVTLEELHLKGCRMLTRLPNLKKLRKLRKLDISECPLIIEIPGLGDLVSLEKLHSGANSYPDEASYSLKLSDMRELCNLRVLRLRQCILEAVLGFESLISLEKVVADFTGVVDKPSLLQLTKLQRLDINGWSSEGLEELTNLVMLHTLVISYCSGVDVLPDLRNLNNLQSLRICQCEFKDMSGLSDSSALETLVIGSCKNLERIPDLQRLTRLESLEIRECAMLRRWHGTLGQVEGSSFRLNGAGVEFDYSQRVTGLHTLILAGCKNLVDVRSNGAFSQLESLECSSLPAVKQLPDLSNFPRLKTLELSNCDSLRRLMSRELIRTLSELRIDRCSCLATLDLSNFSGLLKLEVKECHSITTLSSTRPLTALQQLEIRLCSGLGALPDLGMFPALENLVLEECVGLLTLSSTVPLPALKVLEASGCRSLVDDDFDQLQALCSSQCKIKFEPLSELDVERSLLRGCFGRKRLHQVKNCAT